MMNCPCCGQDIDKTPPVDSLKGLLASHGHISRRIIELLAGAYPRSIAGPRLADLVYENDPDGGPANNSMSVVIFHLRKKLEPCGWTIPHANGHGYRLEALAGRA